VIFNVEEFSPCNWTTESTFSSVNSTSLKEHGCTQLEESSTETAGRRWLSDPEPDIGCSALEEAEDEEEELRRPATNLHVVTTQKTM
jgi:hypothetical protein